MTGKRVKALAFTANNYSDDDLTALTAAAWVKYGVAGKEIAPSTGTPHLQGYVSLKKQTRGPKARKALQDLFKNHCHIEDAKQSAKANRAYCMKSGDFVEWGEVPAPGRRSDIAAMYKAIKEGADEEKLQEEHTNAWFRYYKACDRVMKKRKKAEIEEKLAEQFVAVELHEWQKNCLATLMQQDDREVTWVVDPKGNNGKTWLAKYLRCKHGAFYTKSAKKADIIYAYNYEEIVVFDLTRSTQEFVNYDVIECFKDGLAFSGKYESELKAFEPCKVLVLSNWYPEKSKLSEDRWNIIKLCSL